MISFPERGLHDVELFKNLCETGGEALDIYIAAHGPGEVSLKRIDIRRATKAREVSEFLKNLSESKPKYENVYDGFDENNPDVGGRLQTRSSRDCAGIYMSNKEDFAKAKRFLKKVDAFALCAENNPGGGVLFTLDWRIENVRF